jgi:hypothetical protein
MNDELERIWKAVVMAYVRYYSGILFGRIEENYENFSQDIQCPGRDLNQVPPPITS